MGRCRGGWGPGEEVFLHCCTVVETVALSLSFSYSRLFSGIYSRLGCRGLGGGGGVGCSVLFSKKSEEKRGFMCTLTGPLISTLVCLEVNGEEEEGDAPLEDGCKLAFLLYGL